MYVLIPALALVVVIAFAVRVQMLQGRYEHAFTRFLYLCFYLALAFVPTISIETARFYNRWFLALLFVTEIFSFYFRFRGKRHE